MHRYPIHRRSIYLAPTFNRNCYSVPIRSLLSGDTREKVTFLGSTTRTKVTFDPEKGGLRCTNSRKKVTMYPEKGDFFQFTTLRFEITREKVAFCPDFKGSPKGNCIFNVAPELPGER